jgi:hypothetical protein
MTFTLSRRAAVAALALSAAASLAQAQEFPTKPVRIITPFPVGSGPEGVARLVADKLSRMWGKPVTVENRPGGNGFIAIDAFKRGATDGHDLIQLDNVHLSAYPHLFKKLPYDSAKDFDTLLPLFKTYFFVTTAVNSKYKNRGRPDRRRQGQPGQAELRLVVGGQPGAPGLGAVRHRQRHEDGARDLQGDHAAVHQRGQRRPGLRAGQQRHLGRRCTAPAS